MSIMEFELIRPEGGVILAQDEDGVIRIKGKPTHHFEQALVGRPAQEAIYITQQISADSSVSHALAAALAWEKAAGISPPSNGFLLRDLLHSLSLLHAHLRHFYFDILPDYLPLAALGKYKGPLLDLQSVSNGIDQSRKKSWRRYSFSHPFNKVQTVQLAENMIRAVRVMSMLQRMMAVVGGKFPLVMSIVPGGVSLRVRESLIIKLRNYLFEIAGFLRQGPLEDGMLLLGAHPALKKSGRGKTAFICVGSLGEETGPEASLFPSGAYVENGLEPLQPSFTESIAKAFYSIPTLATNSHRTVESNPQKEGAYSWIKAPRYLDKVSETGPLARLIIAHLSGSRRHTAASILRLERYFKKEVVRANTTGGRILAGLGEVPPLVKRCEEILENLAPGQSSLTKSTDFFSASGEGQGIIEAPAGALQHRLFLEEGRIAFYDIISPSAWNGTPSDENDLIGGLETALNGGGIDLTNNKGQLAASRIINSYFFSATDAVQ